jgi:hypothetical protein
MCLFGPLPAHAYVLDLSLLIGLGCDSDDEGLHGHMAMPHMSAFLVTCQPHSLALEQQEQGWMIMKLQ